MSSIRKTPQRRLSLSGTAIPASQRSGAEDVKEPKPPASPKTPEQISSPAPAKSTIKKKKPKPQTTTTQQTQKQDNTKTPAKERHEAAAAASLQDKEKEQQLQEFKAALKEIEGWKRKHDNLNNRLIETETEKNTYLYQMGENTKRHKNEVEQLQKQISRLHERNKEMEERSTRIDQVEDAIIKLYLEMKDRSTDVVRHNDDELRKNEEEVERNKLRNENPIAILDMLKANLRTLLIFKEDYENELKDQIRRKKTAAEEKIVELNKQIELLEAEKQDYERAAERAIKMRDEAMSSKKENIEESNNIIMKLKKDNQDLIQLLREREEKIDQLRKVIDKRDALLRNREIQLMKVEKLEREKLKIMLKHQFEMNRLKSEHYKSTEAFKKELTYHNKLKAQKQDIVSELREKTLELNSYKHNTNRVMAEQLEQINKKQKEKIDQLTEELTDTQEKLRKKKVKYKILKTESEKMKVEHAELFNAQIEEKRRRREEEQLALQKEVEDAYKSNIEANPHVAGYYKKKWKEKEKEVVELTKKVRRMILVEHKSNIQEKNFELERSRMITELSSLRKSAPASGKTPVRVEGYSEVDLMTKNRELEEQLRDLENAKAVSMAQAAMYEKQKNAESPTKTPIRPHMQQDDLDDIMNFEAQSPSGASALERSEYRPPSASLFSRPSSASSATKKPAPAASRPNSARNPSLKKIGSSRSTLQIGSLV